MSKINVTVINSGTLAEQTVTVEGETIEIEDGNLVVSRDDGEILAAFAPSRWSRATLEKESV